MNCRSIRYVAREHVEIIEIAVPDPSPGEVQVRGLVCGVCAWDVHVYKNGPDSPIGAGHEGIGEVIKLGAGVTTLKEGDWVTGGGLGFSEYSNRPERGLYKLPAGTRKPEHFIVEPVACIVTGLDHCNLRAGDRVAVVGCGFMGLMFVQALAHSLLDRLIAIDINPDRLNLARRFGPTDCLDAKSLDEPALRDLSIDTVVDCSGQQKGLELSSRIVRKGGRLNLFGWNHGTASFPGDIWHTHGLTIVNSAPNSAMRDPWPIAIRLLARGLIDLSPLVSHVVPLAEYPALLKRAADNDGTYLKGVVELKSATIAEAGKICE
ncbi:MAG TPA: zinc-binding dehydrogenase [Tepidisphaeraceae bacterium]